MGFIKDIFTSKQPVVNKIDYSKTKTCLKCLSPLKEGEKGCKKCGSNESTRFVLFI